MEVLTTTTNNHQTLPAAALTQKQQLLSGVTPSSEVLAIVNEINVLAMANTDVIYIFTHFSGHVNNISFSADHVETNYQDPNRPDGCLPRTTIGLEDEDALEQLLAIESQLTELIIEAREAAETDLEASA
ncbi:hypothetical protein L4D20_05445 [Vibrio kyushuensis]|uniref:hypothetical protein n=1 Tax=Vibrio kyushuensis TaxID=2910249 RepID=UPI003D130E98